MIYSDMLKNVDGVHDMRINGVITREMLKAILEQSLSETGFSISVEYDELVSGGIFNKKKEPCVVIRNSNHRNDYFYYCLYLRTMGNFTVLYSRYGGESPLTQAKNRAEEKKDSLLGIIGVYQIDEVKLDEEYFYYDIVDSAIKGLVPH